MSSLDTPDERRDQRATPPTDPSAPGAAVPPPTEAELTGRERRAAHSDDPQAIREDIERTRREMAGTINAVEDRVSPSRIVERRRSAVRDRVQSLRHSVMGADGGSSSRTTGSYGSGDGTSAGDRVADAASTARDQVQAAPDRAVQRTRGNPMAAGMIAFGLGALLGSALPASDAEQELAERGAQRVDVDRLKQEGRQIAQDVREPVEEEARRGVDEVRATAKDEATDMQDEARSSGERVRDDAEGAKERVAQA